MSGKLPPPAIGGAPSGRLQAQGLLGRFFVDPDGERFDIRAKVTSTVHADQQGLVEFVTGMRQRPRAIRVEGAKHQLAKASGQCYFTAGSTKK